MRSSSSLPAPTVSRLPSAIPLSCPAETHHAETYISASDIYGLAAGRQDENQRQRAQVLVDTFSPQRRPRQSGAIRIDLAERQMWFAAAGPASKKHAGVMSKLTCKASHRLPDTTLAEYAQHQLHIPYGVIPTCEYHTQYSHSYSHGTTGDTGAIL
eukprot:scaffold286770_cov37-Prasinocladus_malaysianus.AAC.2